MRDDHLKHYASPYYDPVKAHEYYMRTRELKGRPSTAGLNEEGRTAAKVVKESLNDERKEMTSYFKEKTHSDIQSHSAHMRYQIKTLRQELNDMEKSKKLYYRPRIQKQINALRQQNNEERQRLQEEFRSISEYLKEDYDNKYYEELENIRNDPDFQR